MAKNELFPKKNKLDVLAGGPARQSRPTMRTSIGRTM